jgi:hypothetical protein
MKPAIIAIKESLPAVATILGQRQIRIPVGGKIRAGIKVLTKKAAEHPAAKDIYERGIATNQSFDEIEQAISQSVPDLKTPLVPKNVAWFTVRPQDFPNPQIANQILDAFGEDRGDGVRRLYRFPVVFPSDLWPEVMPHQLVAWGANDKKYWSEYAPDGRVRYCKCYAPVLMDQGGKRAIRVFGGRRTMLREENEGICTPESCPEFQTRNCNLSGRFIFYIPGIQSIDAFELQTNSFYAMSRAIEQFETVAFMRGGRLSGFLDRNQTSFYLTRKLRDVPHIDEEGRVVRSAHWIIELGASIDVTALLRANDDDETLSNANSAARILEGHHDANTSIIGEQGMIDTQAFESDRNTFPTAEPDDSGTAQVRVAQPESGQSKKERQGTSAEQVIAAAVGLGIDAVRYELYAAKQWGAGWKMNVNGRRRVLEEITRYRNDPEGYADKIDAALDANRNPS